MTLAYQLFEFFHDRMTGKAHAGIGQIGDRLPVPRAAIAEEIERNAGQGLPPGVFEEGLQLAPSGFTHADKLMNDHRVPLSQRVVSIRTPENIELSYALAGPGSRAVAYLIDLFLMTVVLQLLINLIAAGIGLLIAAAGVRSDLWVAGIAGLVSFALYNGYFILFEWLLNGQTPGKRMLHVRVIKQGGYALRFFDTLLRNLLRVVDFLPLCTQVGLIEAFCSLTQQPAIGRSGRRHAGGVSRAGAYRFSAGGSTSGPGIGASFFGSTACGDSGRGRFAG